MLTTRAPLFNLGSGDRCHLGLLPYLDKSLDSSQSCQHEHDPQDRDEQGGEQESKTEKNNSLGALHQTTFGR